MRHHERSHRWSAAVCILIAGFSLSCGGGDGGSPSPTPTNVVVAPGADTLISVGETRTFTAQVLDANGDPIDGATVTWSSDAPGVVSVNATNGVATAVANGSAHVTASAGAIEGSASVVVTQIVASVTVTPGNVAFTSVGDTARFTAVAKDGGGTVVAGVQILWSVSDNTVATIDTLGLARSKGPGNALVSAQAQTRAGYAAIGVDPSVTQFVIIGAPTAGVAGEILTTALQVELRDARGSRVMGSSLAVTIAPAGDATGTPLHGSTTMLADQGRATFSNLWFEHAGEDRFKVTVGALPADSTALVTVEAGPPAAVRLDPVAQFQTAGIPIGLTARVRDRFGNLATNYFGPVTASAAVHPLIGSFYGDSNANAAFGIAQFLDLNFHLADAPWRMTAYIPGTPTLRDTTLAMAVFPGPPSSFVVQHQGRAGLLRAYIDSTVIRVADAFGNNTSGDSLGDTLQVQMQTIGWPYASDPRYAQEAIVQPFADLIDGHATFYPVLRRPGRTRLVFSMNGFAPDTSVELVPELPNLPHYIVSGVEQTALMLTDHATCLLDYISYCAGAYDHGVLGVDSAIVPLDSLWLPADSILGGNAAAGDGGDHHVCGGVVDFFTSESRVACWGDNSDGQLGNGSVGGTYTTPQVVGGFTATLTPNISAGSHHSCALFDGVAACWGKNDVGQLGNGSTGASTGTATAVTGGHTFLQISAGGRHTCAVDDVHALWCWGANDYGQLGDSGVSGAFATAPVAIWPGHAWRNVAAGDDFTCAIALSTGVISVYCWGRNDRLQLGPTHTADSLSKVPVTATAIAGNAPIGVFAGGQFACASVSFADAGQGVQCWGANEHGQLGRGTISVAEASSAPPLAVVGLPDIELPVLGRTHACATTREDERFVRRIVCWGENSDGRFGIGRTGGDEPTPLFLEAEY